ncbi:MAG: hypothetical protein QOJ16_2184 [Acidobacteriota bacterium]|jgi:hypothetical protein|nr:hypothetical protein [Acidobacteriota bacterium]
MTTWEIIAEKTKELPTDKQQQILDFVEFVRARTPQEKGLKDPAGLLADLGVDIDAEALSEARREMWGTFPREIP